MNTLGQLGVVDLLIGLLVVLAVLGAARRRSGLLGALAAGLTAAVLCWLTAAVALDWGSSTVISAVRSSALLDLVPPPSQALIELQRLVETAGLEGPFSATRR